MTEPRLGFVRALMRWARRDFYWWLLLVPAVVAPAVYALSEADVFGMGDGSRFKVQMEVVHPSLLAVMAGLSWGWWAVARTPAFAFLGVLALFVFAREFMGQGSSEILYLGVIGLLVYGNRRRETIEPFLKNRLATSLVGACVACYVLSQLLDRNILLGIARGLSGNAGLKIGQSSNMEEALETTGGLLLMLTPVAVRYGGSRRAEEPTA